MSDMDWDKPVGQPTKAKATTKPLPDASPIDVVRGSMMAGTIFTPDPNNAGIVDYVTPDGREGWCLRRVYEAAQALHAKGG